MMTRHLSFSFLFCALCLLFAPAARAEFGFYYVVRRVSLEAKAGQDRNFIRQHIYRFENQRQCEEFAETQRAKSDPPRKIVFADCVVDTDAWDDLFAGRAAGEWYLGWDDGVKPRTVMTIRADYFDSEKAIEEHLKAIALVLLNRAVRDDRWIDVWAFGPNARVNLNLPQGPPYFLRKKREKEKTGHAQN